MRLHNKELHDWCSLPNVIQVIKSRRERWKGHVAWHIRERGEVHTGFGGGGLKERNYWEELSKDGRTHLQEIGRGRGRAGFLYLGK
jgi:hypothetical protein